MLKETNNLISSMVNDAKNFNWPGWPLDDNPYGENFDLAARKRMLRGSQMLLPFLKKYKKKLGSIILEVGPFFNPLVTPEGFPLAKIFFWENDYHVVRYLKNIYPAKKVYPIFCDLNKIEGSSLLKLKIETRKYFNELDIKKIAFDAVIISHVFNYIDYKLFLMVLKEFIDKDCIIFINNVIDYGLPVFFSDKRPKSIQETMKTIRETGYNIIEKKIFESLDGRYQKNERLIVVAKNNEK